MKAYLQARYKDNTTVYMALEQNKVEQVNRGTKKNMKKKWRKI